MSQVIRNLVSNAMKFTAEGGSVAVSVRHYELEVVTPENHRCVIVCVSEGGCGCV